MEYEIYKKIELHKTFDFIEDKERIYEKKEYIEKMVDGINVLASDGEIIMTTLEGEEHKPPKGATLICDKNKEPVAIAGVKGGLKSGISDETNSVLFEAAVFDSENIDIGEKSAYEWAKAIPFQRIRRFPYAYRIESY